MSKLTDLFLQGPDDVPGAVNGCAEPSRFPLPTGNSFHLCELPAMFCVDLVAEFAFLTDWDGLHYEFHPARFTSSVFSVAMLSEVAPFPVPTLESVLIEEAHVWDFGFLWSNC